ncbi:MULTISPECIES: SDR family oxidoreductase [Bizionia]|uniref:SDR family oxidoreductase n=1 Tax=Bizionia algoritergicola TaxID=291187 RepID=A0A5D0QZI7_9FLAO|nr:MULTISPECIES: SDR family oxidoreductase [Bizionia]OBX22431.1 NAD-dependent dehydratase [Bizionia sp. APA-3]TYB74672.1 SDR family oxidoreductase [Bizionia algoritergicola]
MENILVAGAHGTTGKKIVNLLSESQYFNPIAMVRKEEQIPFFKSKNVDTILADLEQDVSPAFKTPIDKVIFAAGSGGKNVVAVDQEGAKKLIDASKQNNIRKFVMLSSMGADNPESVSELKDYLKAKQNADNHLIKSGLNYSIVRPGALTDGELSNKIELESKLNKQGEISRNDVAQTLVRTLNDDVANKATFEIIKGDTLIADALNKISTIEVS